MADAPKRRRRNVATAARQTALKLDAALFRQIADNTGVHVIVADRELRIVYLNPASVSTLRKLQHLLPCPVDDMVTQIVTQSKAVGFTILFSGIGSLVLFKLVDIIVGLRPEEQAEREGLDITQHGERAYNS